MRRYPIDGINPIVLCAKLIVGDTRARSIVWWLCSSIAFKNPFLSLSISVKYSRVNFQAATNGEASVINTNGKHAGYNFIVQYHVVSVLFIRRFII